MRIYSSVLEAVKEIERDLFEMGVENKALTVQDLDVKNNSNYDSKELIGYGYVITKFDEFDLNDLFTFFFEDESEKEAIVSYCKQELSERLSGCALNPGMSWEYRRDYWERFLHEKKFSYTYSERISDQFLRVVQELMEAPESRQCMITIYDKHLDLKNLRGAKRIPCSISYQFLKRRVSGRYKLFMIYVMRSCDFYSHFPIDLWLAINMGKSIGDLVGCELYSFTHFMGSLHSFRKDYEKRRIF